jgi:hypothetical protein
MLKSNIIDIFSSGPVPDRWNLTENQWLLTFLRTEDGNERGSIHFLYDYSMRGK